nr:MAG TPA_asm: hypothetical protein [Caudoviricetes sp.]
MERNENPNIKIALELLEQLKSKHVTFADAKEIVRHLGGMVKQEMEEQQLNNTNISKKPSDTDGREKLWREITAINQLMRLKEDEFATSIKEKFLISLLLSDASLAISILALLML